MPREESRHRSRHRAVDEHHEPRDARGRDESTEVVEHVLRPLDRERWNHDVAAARDGVGDRVLEPRLHITARVQSIAVRRFDDDGLGFGQVRGRPEDRSAARTPQIARERDPALGEREPHDRRTEDVPGVEELRADSRSDRRAPAVADVAEVRWHCPSVSRGVQRPFGVRTATALACMAPTFVCGVFLENVRRVFE